MIQDPKKDFEVENGSNEDIENINSDILSAEEQAKIILQIQNEYQICWDDQNSKKAEWRKRLKLYNNQKRDTTKVGDPLLFTVFQTVFASLYNDKLSVRWEPREMGDYESAENLTAVAENDYQAMDKDVIDYDFDWNAMFFGRGLLLLHDFNRQEMVPMPEVIDNLCWFRDPLATSVNGNKKGIGRMRFGGREIGLTKAEMKRNKSFFNVSAIKKGKDIKSDRSQAQADRATAQGRTSFQYTEERLTTNYEYELLEWFTMDKKGDLYLATLANQRNLLVRWQKIGDYSDDWPIIDRPIFPVANDWDGVSIPDLIEDKQRAKAVLINLGLDSAKADMYPMYLYDKMKIKNPDDLDFAFNKPIPVNGSIAGAMAPLQKSTFHEQTNLILNILDTAAQKAVAAPEIAQGVQPSQQRTLGETEMVAAGSGIRHGLAARVFGWSEKKFWQQWYRLYKKYFKSALDEKIIRLQGPLAPDIRKLTPENLKFEVDPDVYVEALSITEQKRQKSFAEFSQFAQIILQDPDVNRRFILRKLGRISQIPTAELQLIFPPTIDELVAQDENASIENNKLPEVHYYDDDVVHIEIHNRASDQKAKLAHIEAHKKMMLYKKMNPESNINDQSNMGNYKPINGAPVQKQQIGVTQRGQGLSNEMTNLNGQQS